MKKSFHITSIILGCATFSSAYTNASPKMYSKCDRSVIKSPKNSGGFHFSEDCKKVYVLPPVLGKMSITAYNPEQSDSSDCIDLAFRKEKLKKNIDDIKIIDKEISDIEKKISKSKNNCTQESATVLKKEAALKVAGVELNKSQSMIENVQKRLKECEISLCTLDVKNTLEKELTSYKTDYSYAEIDYSDAKSEYDEAKIKNDSCMNQQNLNTSGLLIEKQEKTTRKNELEETQETLNRYIRKVEDRLIDQPGGTFSLTFLTEHENLVNEFRKLNGDGISFEKMPMKKAMLTFQNINPGNNKDVSGIYDQYVDGFSSFDSVPKTEIDNPSSQVIIGNAVTGKLTINKLTACEIQNNRKLTQAQMIKKVANLMTSTAVYAYDLNVNRTIKGQLSNSKLYCLIRKQTDSNGLFSTSSVDALTEKSNSSFVVNLEVESEDSDIAFNEKMAEDIRKEMIDRALKRVASIAQPSPIDLRNPPKPAAEGLSNGLKSCSNFFCSVASFGLDLGSALFGGKVSTSSTCQDISDFESLNTKESIAVRSYTSQGIVLEN